jgi:mannose-1-phosphate guanylyltransferase
MVGSHTFTVVLAGGEGQRLHSLTTTETGVAVPKQFCSFNGGASLLATTLQRLSTITPRSQAWVVLSEEHRALWQRELWSIRAGNAIVQPQRRGTALGLLLALLVIERRDPDATILTAPADHHIENPRPLRNAMRDALTHAQSTESVVLLGMEPRDFDPELGYITTGATLAPAVHCVDRFVEKPRALSGDPGRHLWNSFMLAAPLACLLDLYDRLYPEIVIRLREVLAHADCTGAREPDPELADLYARLPSIDFSRDVLEHHAPLLRVLRVADCGWSDLGTPARVAATLHRTRIAAETVPLQGWSARMDLAAAFRSRDSLAS